MGLSGQVPSRVDAVTKHALLTLVDDAVHSGWTCRDACRYVEVSQRRVERWKRRVHTHGLDDRVPGGNPVHGLTPAEATLSPSVIVSAAGALSQGATVRSCVRC